MYALNDHQLGGDIDGPIHGTVDRALLLEHGMDALRGHHLFGGNVVQAEDDVNTTEYEHTVLHLHLAARDCREASSTGSNLARLQRAAQGAEQSTRGRGDDVINRGRMRIRHVAMNPVMAGNRAVRAEADRLGFSRQLRQAQWSLHSNEWNLGTINNVAHRFRRVRTRSPARAGAIVPRSCDRQARFSSSAFNRARSFLFARRTASPMRGATQREKPLGSPRFRNVMRVPPPGDDSHS